MKIFVLLSFPLLLTATTWDSTNFPNPVSNNFGACNIPSKGLVCDPDNVLTAEDRERLSNTTKLFEEQTKQSDGKTFCERKGITVGVAVVNNIEGGTEEVRLFSKIVKLKVFLKSNFVIFSRTLKIWPTTC